MWDGPGAALTVTNCCAPKGHEKGECPFRLRLNSGAALHPRRKRAECGAGATRWRVTPETLTRKAPLKRGQAYEGTLRKRFFGVFRSGTTPRAGIGSTKEKPRRVTGLRVMVGPVGLATNPTRSRSRANASELGRRQAVLAIGHNAEFNVRHALLGPSARNEYRGESRHYPLRRTQGTEKQAGPPRCPEEEYRPPYP